MSTEGQNTNLVLGRYDVLSEIARGGFGAVYKAWDRKEGQTVAIKRLLTDDKAQQERFEREMLLIKKLSNPHTVRLLNYGEDGVDRIMVLEFVEGEPLSSRIERGAMPEKAAVQVIQQILGSLAEAHVHGIVHRDMKPLNIMLTGSEENPHTKLLDFGTAGVQHEFQDDNHKQITGFGEIQGTPSYMAPEQILNFADACTQSDLYAVGLILYECLTGETAFTGRNPLEICTAQVQKPLVLSPALAGGPFGEILKRSTAKNVGERYQSAEEMIAALAGVHLSEISAPLQQTAQTRVKKPLQKNPGGDATLVMSQPEIEAPAPSNPLLLGILGLGALVLIIALAIVLL